MVDDPAIAASAASIQAVMKGKVARQDAMAQLALLESVTTGSFLVTLRVQGDSATFNATAFESEASAASTVTIGVHELTTSLLSPESCFLVIKTASQEASQSLVGKILAGMKVWSVILVTSAAVAAKSHAEG